MRTNGFSNSRIIKHTAMVSDALLRLIWSCSADWRKQWTLANVINQDHIYFLSGLSNNEARETKQSFPLTMESHVDVHADTCCVHTHLPTIKDGVKWGVKWETDQQNGFYHPFVRYFLKDDVRWNLIYLFSHSLKEFHQENALILNKELRFSLFSGCEKHLLHQRDIRKTT